MTITDFLSIGIIGSALSAIFQLIKNYMPTTSAGNKLIMIGASLVLGSAYYFFSQTAWWVDVLGVLAAASTIYSMFFAQGTTS